MIKVDFLCLIDESKQIRIHNSSAQTIEAFIDIVDSLQKIHLLIT